MKITEIRATAPPNYKSSSLVLGRYRKLDILILLGATCLFIGTILSSMFIIEFNIWIVAVFGFMIPAILIGIVQPVNNYHNFLEFFRLKIMFLLKDRHYSKLVITRKKVKRVKGRKNEKNKKL